MKVTVGNGVKQTGLCDPDSKQGRRRRDTADLEFGLGWQSLCGRFRVKAGYYIGAWFNTVTTPAFLDAVQSNDFVDQSDTLTFDGLALRLELQF